MPRRHVLVVLTNAVPGGEDAYNDWYSNRHLQDVLAVPGVVSAQRYVVSEAQRVDDPAYRYCALYEIETDDLALVMDEIGKRAGTEAMPISDAMARDRLAIVFKPLGAPVTG
jgi:hypothetical protein